MIIKKMFKNLWGLNDKIGEIPEDNFKEGLFLQGRIYNTWTETRKKLYAISYSRI